MVELTAECDAITDGYNLRAKKFSDTGEDSVLCVDFNSVLSTNSLQFGLSLSSKLSANSKFVSTFCQRSCTVSTVASWCMASGVMIFYRRDAFFQLLRLQGNGFRHTVIDNLCSCMSVGGKVHLVLHCLEELLGCFRPRVIVDT